MHIRSYQDLEVWQVAMDLAAESYRHTSSYPKTEIYGLISQIRRAAASIPSNIAEGHGRESTQSFIQFLRIAQGSVKELETHLLLAVRVGFAEQSHVEGLLGSCGSVGRMLRALIRTLQDK